MRTRWRATIPLALSVVVQLSLPGAAHAVAAPCPAGSYPDELIVSAPPRLAFDRTATLSFDYSDGPVSAVKVELRQRSTGNLMMERWLTDAEARRLSDESSTGFTLPILQASEATGAITVSVSYDTGYTDFLTRARATCRATKSLVVEAVPGARPAFEVVDNVGRSYDDVRLRVRARTPCAEVAPGTIRFEFRGRRTTVLSTADTCAGFDNITRRGPRLPGIDVRDGNGEKLSGIVLGTEGKRTFTRRYRLKVTVGKQVLYQGWVLVRHRYYKAYRVYEGTDAFVNYCIHESRPIYSSKLRLYCDSPGSASSTVQVSRRKPSLRP